MATRYQCKTCGKIFFGHDPIYFGTFAQPSFPFCPDDEAHVVGLAVVVSALTVASPAAKTAPATPAPAKSTPPAAPATLATVGSTPTPAPIQPVGPTPTAASVAPPKPAAVDRSGLQGAWGRGPLILKEETKEEKDARERIEAQQQQQREAQQRERMADQKATQLIGRIERMIEQGTGRGVSANFPKDYEYGFKASGAQLAADYDTIIRAGAKWMAKAPSSDFNFRPPKFKKVWDQYQANFEKLIVSGNPDEGKHNVHVVQT